MGCSDDAVAAGFKAVSLLLDPVSGKILRTFHQAGGSDEVWFDSASSLSDLKGIGCKSA